MLKLGDIIIDDGIEMDDIEYTNKECCENCTRNKKCEIQEKVKIDFEYCNYFEIKQEGK